MKKFFIKVIQWLFCLGSWLTISPLFYYLAKRWKLLGKKLRITFLCISPLALIIYFFLSVCGFFWYENYQRKYRFTNKETLENITGVKFPDFKIVKYEQGTSFPDYNDELLIEFEEIPSEDFYQAIDSLSNWNISNQRYVYNVTWGNGLPAPKGEDDDEDMLFSIRFEKGSKEAVIAFGTW